MAKTVVTEVVLPVAKWTLKRIWQELGYVFCYKSNIGVLNEQIQGLHDKRDGVDLEVKPAREALKNIDPAVDRWLGDVDKIIKEKEMSFSEETVAAKAVCCSGWLPNLKCRHSLGRKAKKMTEKVDELFTKDLGTIVHPAPHPEVEFQPTEDSTQLGKSFHEGASSSGTSDHEQPPGLLNFDSRRSTIKDVVEALRGNQVNPIIICGMGGIGKTTLMGQVLEKAKEEGLYHEYTKATFRESLNRAADLCLIQDELARYLGLPLEGKETDARASKLRQRLSQGSKKILVMLDNVWTTTPDFLWDIGIPSCCQVLVTSRHQDLFKNMDTRKNFPIHGLPKTEAWTLFMKTAGDSTVDDPDFRDVADKILDECAGLPIAISTVGTALKGEPIAIWKNALGELKKACPENVPGVIEHVYGKIKLSYDYLPNEQARSCLLLCCIFEETADVPVEDLVRYGLGLQLFKGIDSVVEGRNRVETVVRTLKSRFLLLECGKEDFVRMHDVVRDVARHIASEEYVEKKSDGVEKRIAVRDKTATLKLMDWPKDKDSEQTTHCSSLGISGLCQFLLVKKLTMLSFRYDIPLEPPPIIFNKMEDLKVLAIFAEKFSFYQLPLDVLPSLAVLRNLQTLRIEYYRLEDASVIGELKTLMILSLRGSNIDRLPITFRNLSNLRLLDLSDCQKLEVISPGVIKSLFRLEELYMWNSFQDWVVEKLASTETTNWISQLEKAEEEYGFISDGDTESWKSLNRLPVEQRENEGRKFFRWEVQVGWTETVLPTRWANSMDWETGILAELLSLSCLTTLEVVLPPVIIVLTSTLFNKLERFRIYIGWKEGRSWEFKQHDINENYLGVQGLVAGGFPKKIGLDASVVGRGFTSLLKKTSILECKLKDLTDPQLRNILDTVCLAKAKRLQLTECNNVEHLNDTTTTNSSSGVIFPVLNSLEINFAWRLKEIFHGELPTGSLKELRNLKLDRLPALTHIWKTNSRSEWDVFRITLEHFQVLCISDCESLEEIVAFEYDQDEINFQSLTYLNLERLPNFISISKNTSNGPESLPEDSSPGQSDVIMKPLFDTKVHFPVLTQLQISNMNFKKIWENQLSAESFCELKTLVVSGFDKLLHLVPTHMQNRFQKLECIQAWYCSSLEEIFEFRRLIVDDEAESENQGTQINKTISFKQSHQAFQNLKMVSILKCDSLRTLLSPSVARGLVKLQTLEINECQMIEEIIAAPAEGEEIEDVNMFPQLHTLRLEGLPNLGSFSQGKYNFKWPLVRDIKISRCNNMKNFCLGTLNTSMGSRIDVEGAGERVWQELNNSRQFM